MNDDQLIKLKNPPRTVDLATHGFAEAGRNGGHATSFINQSESIYVGSLLDESIHVGRTQEQVAQIRNNIEASKATIIKSENDISGYNTEIERIDTRFTSWKEFYNYQKNRGITDTLLLILKDIYAHINLQYKLPPESIYLRKEKMTFHTTEAPQLRKLFLNVHIKKNFLRLLLVNNGVIPAIATVKEGVKGYPNLHEIELRNKQDFTTEVRIAILQSFKVIMGSSLINQNGKKINRITQAKTSKPNDKILMKKEVSKVTTDQLNKPKISKIKDKENVILMSAPQAHKTRTMINSANDYAISDLFNNDKNVLYYIPKYQREYVWGKWNWESLFDDLEEHAPGHFLGSIICINKKIDSQDIDRLELVDGQQRMTTLSLLFTALYKYIKQYRTEEDDDLVTDINNLKYRIILKADKKTLRLQPSISSNNLRDFRHIIGNEVGILKDIEKSKNAGVRRIVKAYKYFLGRLEEVNDNNVPLYGLEGAKEFLRKVNSAILVKIEVSNHSDAFTLFETLNNRGVPLAAMDLIKNSFLNELEKAESGTIDENFAKWNKLIQNLTEDAKVQERFLRHFYNAYKEDTMISVPRRSKATRSNLIDIYDTLIKRGADTFFDRLYESSKKYNSLIIPKSDENSKEVQNSLINFQNVGGAPGYALLLYVWEKFDPSDQQKVELINFLVKYFVRRNVTDTPPTRDLDNIFIELMRELGKLGTYKFSFIDSLLRKDARFASDELFREKLEGSLYDENAAATRFILCKLEESNNKTKEKFIDFWARDQKNNFIWTIEHIFPQGKKIPKKWVEMIANGDKDKAQLLQAQYVHTLGNLTLSGFNSSLGNKPFLDKRDRQDKENNFVGFKNGLFLNEELKTKEKWTIEDIQARSKYLINLAMDLFK